MAELVGFEPASTQPINQVGVVPPRVKFSYQRVALPIKDSDITVTSHGEYQADVVVKNTKIETVNQFYHAIQDKVPTMRIAVVKVNLNTSIFHDEVLHQKFGLLSVVADVDEFVSMTNVNELTEKNCIEFHLKVECPEGEVVGKLITTADLTWHPLGEQKKELKIKPKILYNMKLFTLTPGQKVDIILYAARGTGDIHAGWRPTSNVSYKLKPIIRMKKPISGERAKEIADVCPKNVFDIEDTGMLVAARSISCSMCRECTTVDMRSDEEKLVIKEKRDAGKDKLTPAEEKVISYISLSHDENEVHIGIKSRGVMPARTIMTRALEYVTKLAEQK